MVHHVAVPIITELDERISPLITRGNIYDAAKRQHCYPIDKLIRA
jgi:hypothetical protein